MYLPCAAMLMAPCTAIDQQLPSTLSSHSLAMGAQRNQCAMIAAASPVFTTAMSPNKTPCRAGFQDLPAFPRLGTLRSVTATADLLHAAAVRQKVRATWSRRMRASALVFDEDEDENEDDKDCDEDGDVVPSPGDAADVDDGDDGDESPVPRPRANSSEEMTE